MKRKGIIIFFIIFVIITSLFQVYILKRPFNLNLILWSVLSGILSLGIIYLLQKNKKSNVV